MPKNLRYKLVSVIVHVLKIVNIFPHISHVDTVVKKVTLLDYCIHFNSHWVTVKNSPYVFLKLKM